MNRSFFLFLLAVIMVPGNKSQAQGGFRVFPYLQNPAPDAMTVTWFSNNDEQGTLFYREMGSEDVISLQSSPEPALTLAYPEWEDTTFFQGVAPAYPWRNRLRLEGLEPARYYEYIVKQGSGEFRDTFRTAPGENAAIRFIVYSDSETEPESTGKFTTWPDPASGENRSYLVDQTTGYRNNLEVIRSRKPDLVIIPGDLVESGGEQRDWDEFWLHNARKKGGEGIASSIPILAAPGNHEYYNGPKMNGYAQPGSETAINRYLSYFEYPPNNASNPEQEGRYYAIEYGPAGFIILDLCNHSPDSSEWDTNYQLQGEKDPGGGNAPDFLPGSEQFNWLEDRLKEFQEKALFSFVIFHHAPYSSGPHGFPAGIGSNLDWQSGVPVRDLTPFFMQYGVDAVFSGHDEMWERSVVEGFESLPDGSQVPHTLHFYDVGTGGDGLRGPTLGTDNPFQVFLAHTNSPEVWEDSALTSGGKHYGHLEVNITPGDSLKWEAILEPVYILPVKEKGDSLYNSYKRLLYDDRVRLIRQGTAVDTSSNEPTFTTNNSMATLFCRGVPNPFQREITISYNLPEPADVSIVICDLQGKIILRREQGGTMSGEQQFLWDAQNEKGKPVAPGIYYVRISSDSGLQGMFKLVKY